MERTKRGVRVVPGRDSPQIFILLTSLTDEGAKTLKANPERVQQVNEELETLGVHVTGQWAVLGPYDFVSVVEAPDNVTMARVSAELASRGSIRVMTLPATPIAEFVAAFQAANAQGQPRP
ncbi:MAG TPA: GYD domain-containing protein [Chloroflexota bacterium]|nr:GYD domain-containing protein [Chloroflexota bacterium]